MRGNDDQRNPECSATWPWRSGSRRLTRCERCARWWTRCWPRCRKEFDGLYAKVGRPSIPPERLFRALLLQVFYSVRSERLLMEQLDYNLLFRWFVGLEMDEPVWNHAVFSKNRDRLLNQELAQQFFGEGQGAGSRLDER